MPSEVDAPGNVSVVLNDVHAAKVVAATVPATGPPLQLGSHRYTWLEAGMVVIVLVSVVMLAVGEELVLFSDQNGCVPVTG